MQPTATKIRNIRIGESGVRLDTGYSRTFQFEKKSGNSKTSTADINIFHHRAFTRVSLKKLIIVK